MFFSGFRFRVRNLRLSLFISRAAERKSDQEGSHSIKHSSRKDTDSTIIEQVDPVVPNVNLYFAALKKPLKQRK